MDIVEDLPKLIPRLCFNVFRPVSLEQNLKNQQLQECMNQLSEFYDGSNEEERGEDRLSSDGRLRAAYIYQYMLYGIAAFSNRVWHLRHVLAPAFR
jgi:hypothetical protein